MEINLYTLDSLLRRERVIDQYKSLIWTERFQDLGEIEIVIESNSEVKKYLLPGTWVTMSESYRVMRIDTIEDSVEEDGNKVLSIKGASIETLLDERVARPALDDLVALDVWYITGNPKTAVETVFQSVCADGDLDVADIIPYLTSTPIFPADGLPDPPSSTVENAFQLGSVLEAIKPICEAYDMGFRLCRDPDSNQLKFDVYMGTDRTTDQTTVPAVVFGPDFDNITNTKNFASTVGVKNIAYVFSPVGYEIVAAPDVDPDIAGFERKVLMVRADDIDDGVPATATAKMIDRGLEALAQLRDIQAFDGQVGDTSQYTYDTDYYLGDIIEVRGYDGQANLMRVTEQIFVQDEEGARTYPTLVAKKLITADSWLGWSNMTWLDLDADSTTWGDLDT